MSAAPRPLDERDPVVVTGIGAVSALGTGREETWRAFAAGESGVRSLADDDPRRARGSDTVPLPEAGCAGWVRGFDPRAHVRGTHLRRMDWCSRILVAASRLAAADAGALPLGGARGASTAIIAGSCYGNQRETAAYLDRVFTVGLAAGQPILFPNLVLNAAAGYAAIELDVQGPNLTLAEHEVSGEVAIATACELLRAGTCALALAGGFDEFGSVLQGALAERRRLALDALPEASRRRARAAHRGLAGRVILGEGAAVLALERASAARARGARIQAQLEPVGVRGLPSGPYAIPRDAGRVARAIADTIGVTASAPISAVLGCSDGSRERETIDAAVLAELERRQGAAAAYAPFRRLTGEFGAAGALGAALAALAVADGGLPPAAFSGRASAAAERLLVVGVGRSGALAPLVVRRFAGDAG